MVNKAENQGKKWSEHDKRELLRFWDSDEFCDITADVLNTKFERKLTAESWDATYDRLKREDRVYMDIVANLPIAKAIPELIGRTMECIRSSDSRLTKGDKYLVTGINGNDFRLKGVESSWDHSRFTLCPEEPTDPPKFKIECCNVCSKARDLVTIVGNQRVCHECVEEYTLEAANEIEAKDTEIESLKSLMKSNTETVSHRLIDAIRSLSDAVRVEEELKERAELAEARLEYTLSARFYRMVRQIDGPAWQELRLLVSMFDPRKIEETK